MLKTFKIFFAFILCVHSILAQSNWFETEHYKLLFFKTSNINGLSDTTVLAENMDYSKEYLLRDNHDGTYDFQHNPYCAYSDIPKDYFYKIIFKKPLSNYSVNWKGSSNDFEVSNDTLMVNAYLADSLKSIKYNGVQLLKVNKWQTNFTTSSKLFYDNQELTSQNTNGKVEYLLSLCSNYVNPSLFKGIETSQVNIFDEGQDTVIQNINSFYFAKNDSLNYSKSNFANSNLADTNLYINNTENIQLNSYENLCNYTQYKIIPSFNTGIYQLQQPTMCLNTGDSLVLNSTNNVAVNWFKNNELVASNTSYFSVKSAGNYSYSIDNKNTYNCKTSSNTITVCKGIKLTLNVYGDTLILNNQKETNEPYIDIFTIVSNTDSLTKNNHILDLLINKPNIYQTYKIKAPEYKKTLIQVSSNNNLYYVYIYTEDHISVKYLTVSNDTIIDVPLRLINKQTNVIVNLFQNSKDTSGMSKSGIANVKINNTTTSDIFFSDSLGNCSIPLQQDGNWNYITVTKDGYFPLNYKLLYIHDTLYINNINDNNQIKKYFLGNSIDFELFKKVAKDVSIELNTSTLFRPGFTSNLYLYLRNLGNEACTGKLYIEYSAPIFDPNNSLDSSTTGTKTKVIDFSLEPDSLQYIDFLVKTFRTSPLNQAVAIRAYVVCSGDLNASNDTSYFYSTTRGSWDPNDISVSPQGPAYEDQTLKNIDFAYTIRFQNTGNDTAFTVVVVDTLPSNLDISSLKMLGASHKYNLKINGNIATWTFNSINLLDSTTNEEKSNGSIQFKIAQKANLNAGSVIENSASIYFDYNLPILTNVSTLKIVDALPLSVTSVSDIEIKKTSVYPNPAQGTITIENRNGSTFMLIDQAGRIFIKESISEQKTIDISHIEPGIYFYNIDGNKYEKLIIK